MESIIIELTKQLLVLSAENATLKIELEKFQNAPVLNLNSKKMYKKEQSTSEQVPSKPKHPGHVASGKKLAIWNATRKKNLNELLEQAKLEGEW